MDQIGIDHISRETHDRGLTAKQHNPSPFCCTSTRGTNSKNALKEQLYVWLLPTAVSKVGARQCLLGEEA